VGEIPGGGAERVGVVVVVVEDGEEGVVVVVVVGDGVEEAVDGGLLGCVAHWLLLVFTTAFCPQHHVP